MSEFLGKVTAVNPDETIEVRIMSGGYKTHGKVSKHDGTEYRVLTRNNKGKPIRRPSGLTVQFAWADVRNGPVQVGNTVMVELQPVSKPVRKI